MTNDRFDEFFPRTSQDSTSTPAQQPLGIVVGGSLSHGLEVKLDRSTMIEGVTVGRYVVIEGRKLRFFGMITDVSLDSSNPMLAKTPPDMSDPFLAEVYQGTGVFGRISVSPMLAWELGSEDQDPKPVKSLPAHFAAVENASEEDVARIFGRADTKTKFFQIGEPLDMEGMKVYLDLDRFVERSSGIFGKTGTGKTFLTRMVLSGIIQQDAAVNLVFDMHNEYGWESATEDKRGTKVKGLKQLFGSQVAIFTLDDESSRRRGIRPDHVVQIGYEQLEPEDIEMLADLMGLTEAGVNAVFALHKAWKTNWLTNLLSDNGEALEAVIQSENLHSGTVDALKRRLRMIERFEFLKPRKYPTIERILEYLSQGVSIVLEFGRYGSSLEAYVLVANYLTRRLHTEYVKRTEIAIGMDSEKPKPVVITIEEAHKFLDPQIARQTIFGTIARELRKYNVTLLVVDQRPSGIDEEVMSQIGTRITCLLDNERDIQAVLTGISGASELRHVLARLDTRQQALLLGHAVKMPVVIKTRTYGTPAFYADMGYTDDDKLQEQLAHHRSLLRDDEEEDGIV